jgi:hypothetical protein
VLTSDKFTKLDTTNSTTVPYQYPPGAQLHPRNEVLSNLNFNFLFRRLGDGDSSAATARESLDSHDLEVVGVSKAVLGPVSKVIASGDRAGRALGLADRPVLLEGGSSSDGRLVGAGVGADSVDTAIAGDGTELSDTGLAGATGVVRAVRLDNVVLSLGAVDPAVDGEVRATGGLVVGGVGDGAGGTG